MEFHEPAEHPIDLQWMNLLETKKAADGNRTHNFALAKLSFAVKLRPQFIPFSVNFSYLFLPPPFSKIRLQQIVPTKIRCL